MVSQEVGQIVMNFIDRVKNAFFADWIREASYWFKEQSARRRFNKVYKDYIKEKQRQFWILKIEEQFWIDLATKMHKPEIDHQLGEVTKSRMLIEAIIDFFKEKKPDDL